MKKSLYTKSDSPLWVSSTGMCTSCPLVPALMRISIPGLSSLEEISMVSVLRRESSPPSLRML